MNISFFDRPNLRKLFHCYLNRINGKSSIPSDDEYSWDDDEYAWSDDEYVWDENEYALGDNEYSWSDDEYVPYKGWNLDNDFTTDIDSKERNIFFYPDVNDKKSYVSFKNVNDFLSYCDRNGYFVSSYCLGNLRYYSCVYCALDGNTIGHCVTEMVCEGSYGSLLYKASTTAAAESSLPF